MAGKVLQVALTGGGSIDKDFGADHAAVFTWADVALNAAALANLLTNPSSFTDFPLIQLSGADAGASGNAGAEWYVDTGPIAKWAAFTDQLDPASTPFAPAPVLAAMQFYRVKIHLTAGTPIAMTVAVDDTDIGTVDVTSTSQAHVRALQLFQLGSVDAGAFLYFTNIRVGTTDGASDIFFDDFASGSTSAWTNVDAGFTVIDDPGIIPPGAPFVTYATTAELFRILKVRDATSDQIAAAQGDLDTATIEINSEVDWPDDHDPATNSSCSRASASTVPLICGGTAKAHPASSASSTRLFRRRLAGTRGSATHNGSLRPSPDGAWRRARWRPSLRSWMPWPHNLRTNSRQVQPPGR
jgi:hypothetical protein